MHELLAAADPTTPPETVTEATNLILDSALALWAAFVARLPLIGVAFLLVVVGWMAARWVSNWAAMGTRKAGGDLVVSGLVRRLTNIGLITAIVLLALNIAGVPVTAALAGLGIAGLAVAFALQSILENFVAGLLLILRKPFRAGDQIIVGTWEGTVTDIDLRTTRLRDYDGEQIIIPNAEVFASALVNLTESPTRRSSIEVGVDYRDDHNEVAKVITPAVQQVEGVIDEPPARTICTALGDSSVVFTVQYWTDSQRSSVVAAQDAVLRATKSALDEAGFTIPWPIRTLVVDDLQDNVVAHRAVQ